jgi:hypothetical protein
MTTAAARIVRARPAFRLNGPARSLTAEELGASGRIIEGDIVVLLFLILRNATTSGAMANEGDKILDRDERSSILVAHEGIQKVTLNVRILL